VEVLALIVLEQKAFGASIYPQMLLLLLERFVEPKVTGKASFLDPLMENRMIVSHL
jgi:hypothetical protein